MKKFMPLFVFLLIPQTSSAMEEVKGKDLQVFTIPGQNGLGSEGDYVKNLLGQNNINIVAVETPHSTPDFGQAQCLKELHTALSKNNANELIIHATSQGTATALNYLGNVDKGKRIKALILEATLGSGNSAIEHTVSGPLMNQKLITDLPFSYYWLPYGAKVLFPFYWPAGKQAIKSIEHIPNDIPIIIAHSKNDPQLSYNDACALYYGLCSKGNKNVYLISKNGRNHIQVLSDNADTSIIQTILKKHQLIQNIDANDNIDLSKLYQPDHRQFKKAHDALLQREKIHERVAYAMRISATLIVLYFVINYCNKLANIA